MHWRQIYLLYEQSIKVLYFYSSIYFYSKNVFIFGCLLLLFLALFIKHWLLRTLSNHIFLKV